MAVDWNEQTGLKRVVKGRNKTLLLFSDGFMGEETSSNLLAGYTKLVLLIGQYYFNFKIVHISGFVPARWQASSPMYLHKVKP